MSKWGRVKLGDYIQQIRGVSYKPKDTSDTAKENYVAILRANNIQDEGLNLNNLIYVDRSKIYEQQFIKAGDIIVCSSSGSKNLVGKAAQAKKDMYVSFGAFCRVVRTNKIFAPYLGNFFKSQYYRRTISEFSSGANINNIRNEHIDRLLIPLPPLETQKQIAKTLDTASELLSMRRQQLAELDNLIRSIFYDMFGDPVTNEKGWKLRKLSEVGMIERGVSKHRPRNDPSLLGGKYPLIQTGDVANADFIIREYKQTYSDKGLSQSRMWKAGTLCITIAANIAKTAILGFDACFPDSVVGFNANQYTNNIFVLYWFTFFQKILEAQAPESAQKNINLRILNELRVIIPPIELQNKFATIVTKIEAQKNLVKKAIEETQLLFDSLMSQYFDE